MKDLEEIIANDNWLYYTDPDQVTLNVTDQGPTIQKNEDPAIYELVLRFSSPFFPESIC